MTTLNLMIMSKKVLLIDDDEDEQLIFTEALKEINDSVKCFCVINAEEAIRFLHQSMPDFVFLDVNMPVLNGFDCLDLIKKDEKLKRIPVIMYSTGMDEAIARSAIRKGAFACIKKENTIGELAKTLKKIFP